MFKILFEKDWDLVQLFPFRNCENWEQVKVDPKFQSHAVSHGSVDAAVSLLGNPSELVPVLRGWERDTTATAPESTRCPGRGCSRLSGGRQGREGILDAGARDAWTDVWVTVATTEGDLYATSSK